MCLPSILRVFGRWDPQAEYKHTEGRAVYWTLEFLKRSAGTPFLQFQVIRNSTILRKQLHEACFKMICWLKLQPKPNRICEVFSPILSFSCRSFHLKSTSVTHDRQILFETVGSARPWMLLTAAVDFMIHSRRLIQLLSSLAERKRIIAAMWQSHQSSVPSSHWNIAPVRTKGCIIMGP